MNVRFTTADNKVHVITDINQLSYEEPVRKFHNKDENTHIIQPLVKKIGEHDLLYKKDLGDSKLPELVINGNTHKDVKFIEAYRYLLRDIGKSTALALNAKHTKDEILYRDKGYTYYPDLGLSVRYASSIDTLREIIRLCKINEFSLSLTVKLRNNHRYRFTL
jgi:hypothetical protein